MDYLIYGLSLRSDPTATIRYVGQTSRSLPERLRDHLKAKTKKVASRYPVSRWCEKHGGDVEIRLLERCRDSDELNEQEIHWIARMGTLTSEGRGGLNLSAGGGGIRGYSYVRTPTQIGNSLTTEQVKQIKRRIWLGESNISISQDYPVNNRTVGNIARGDTWKHVPWPDDLGDRIVFDKNKAQSDRLTKAPRDSRGRMIPGWQS